MKRPRKLRVQLTLAPDVVRKGKELSRSAKRSLSNMIEWLVEQEHATMAHSEKREAA